MSRPGLTIYITDTSVLLNFLCIERMDLLGIHPLNFVITSHVDKEITDNYPEQQANLIDALKRGWIEKKDPTSLDELEIFSRLESEGRIGRGECSAIAYAVSNGYGLAIEDKRAITEVKKIDPNLSIMKTQDIIMSLVELGIMSVIEADEVKAKWEKDHKFALKFGSFAELIANQGVA